MNIKTKKKLYNQASICVFNAITFGNVLEDDLIFSDRHFLVEQILLERMIDGNSGFNKISDNYFLMLYFLGALKTREISYKLSYARRSNV